MEFINNGEARQVRVSEGYNKFRWNCIRKGETVDLPESVGSAYGFTKVTGEVEQVKATESKIGKTPVETKQISVPEEVPGDDDFLKKLIAIKGIGQFTAEDIIRVYGTEEALIEGLKVKGSLPFRNDVEEKLRKEYVE